MKETKYNTCPVATTVKLISGRWKIIILYRLYQQKLRFSDIQRYLETITHRSLTITLRELEADGLISRTVYPEVPPRVEYELTELGQSMRPIIDAMYQWGMTHQDNNKTPN